MFLSIGMLKLNYFLADIFILSAEKQPIKLSWRKIECLQILCKWKQNSAVSLFLYLNSVFKQHRHKLIHTFVLSTYSEAYPFTFRQLIRV